MGSVQAKKKLTIGQLAKRFGLNIRTLRYYEAIGLLPAASRSESGYRLYGAEEEELLRFILQAKSVGFTLEEIQEIMRLGRHGSACCYVRETMGRHIAAIDDQISQLQKVRKQLQSAVTDWQLPRVLDDGQICGLIEQRPASSLQSSTTKERTIMAKRQVEVFIAGCPLCDEAVKTVKAVACPNCEIKVYDLREGCATNECRDLAKSYGVATVPAVVVDGKLADCCRTSGINEANLRALGIGAG
jgi:DNA-binding transcriptional MerR regulator